MVIQFSHWQHTKTSFTHGLFFSSCSHSITRTKPALAKLISQTPNTVLIDTPQTPSPITLKQEERNAAQIRMQNFLTKELRLTGSEVEVVKRRLPALFRSRSIQRQEEAVKLMRDTFGFKEAHLKKIAMQNPSCLTHRAQETLTPKLELLMSLGFSRKDFGEFVSRAPRMLNSKHLDRNIGHLRHLYEGGINLLKALKKDPSILTMDQEKIHSQLEFFTQSGMQNDCILRLIQLCPSILRTSRDATKLRIDYVKGFGISVSSSLAFAKALATITAYGIDKLHEKVEVLQGFGFEEEEINQIMQKCPSVLANSVEKITSVMEYLLKETDVERKIIVKYPVILGLSLERRIVPRHRAFVYLSDEGLFDVARSPSLMYFIAVSEERFMSYYVEGKPYQSQVLEIYKGESSLEQEENEEIVMSKDL